MWTPRFRCERSTLGELLFSGLPGSSPSAHIRIALAAGSLRRVVVKSVGKFLQSMPVRHTMGSREYESVSRPVLMPGNVTYTDQPQETSDSERSYQQLNKVLEFAALQKLSDLLAALSVLSVFQVLVTKVYFDLLVLVLVASDSTLVAAA